MLTSAVFVLMLFYAGAVVATGRSWLRVRTGAIGYSGLRDLTGISDRAVLRRRFGPARPDGTYAATLTEVFRHRRPAGIILADLPVHGLFLAALAAVAFVGVGPLAAAVVTAAAAHAVVLGLAALSILLGGAEPLYR